MKWNEYFSEIKAGHIANVYLFSGAENVTKTEALRRLREAILPVGLEDMNDTTLEGCTARQIIDAAETMPMMSDRRLVTVRDWAPLLAGKSKNEKDEVARVTQYIDAPSEMCTLVFYLRELPDEKKELTKALRKKAVCVDFDLLTEKELEGWVAKRLKEGGKTISRPAFEKLIFMAGHELSRLTGELEKLNAYSGRRKEITELDVTDTVSVSLEYNIFEVVDKILAGDLGAAQKLVNVMIQNGEARLYILAMLERQLRQLTHARYATDNGETLQNIQTTLKIRSTYAAKQVFSQSAKLPAAIWEGLYEDCVAADYQIKSGGLREQVALDTMLLKIADTVRKSKSKKTFSI